MISLRELDLLHLLKDADGRQTAAEIADTMELHESTVKQMVSVLINKFEKTGYRFPVPVYKGHRDHPDATNNFLDALCQQAAIKNLMSAGLSIR